MGYGDQWTRNLLAEKKKLTEKGWHLKRETAEDLRREEALILNWIRDVTASKQARLREIRCKLQGVLHLEGEKTESEIFYKKH